MSSLLPLLRLLSDGRFHSGDELGANLRISRSAVWKQIGGLREIGIGLHAVSGRGYRLERELELLDADLIANHLGATGRTRLQELELHDALDSTNSHLMRRARALAPSSIACLAETQTAGRGRQGRTWVSAFGANISLSLLWRYASGPGTLAGLSLAVGVGVARCLTDLGIGQVALKWPNDVLWQGRKLAGILIEVTGETSGPCLAVVGIGLNVRMPTTAGTEIDQPWVDLWSIPNGHGLSRNRVAGRLIDRILEVMEEFDSVGLQPYCDEWNRLDAHADHPVTLHLPAGDVRGIARGVDAQGALLLWDEGELRRYAAGEVSLRNAGQAQWAPP